MNPTIYERGPKLVKVEAGKVYSWCTCGLSQKQPLCDGAHNKIEGLPFRNMKVQFEEDTEVWFCQCKHTKTPPFCDGSHKTLTDSTI